MIEKSFKRRKKKIITVISNMITTTNNNLNIIKSVWVVIMHK